MCLDYCGLGGINIGFDCPLSGNNWGELYRCLAAAPRNFHLSRSEVCGRNPEMRYCSTSNSYRGSISSSLFRFWRVLELLKRAVYFSCSDRRCLRGLGLVLEPH